MGPRQVLDELHETINGHDPAGGRHLFHPDAHIVAATGRVMTVGGLTRLLDHTIAAFPDLRVTVERWVENGDVVVTEELMHGTHNGEFAGILPTGRPVQLRICHVTRVVEGRIVERNAYHDTAGILRQLA